MLENASEVQILWNLKRFDTLDSTNAEIKRLITAGSTDRTLTGDEGAAPAEDESGDWKRASEGTVVIAGTQEGGYGRQGRFWKSPPGGLYCSLLLRPGDHGVNPTRLPTLSLVIGIAVCRAIESLGGEEAIKVKWPNDVVCSAGKLCGISLEVLSGAVCIGIGINVFEPFEEVTLAGAYNAAYAVLVTQSDELPHKVGSEGLDSLQNVFKEEVLLALLSQVEQCYSEWLGHGFSVFQEEFQRRSSLQGSDVRLATQGNDTITQGEVIGVDDEGRLLLQTRPGEIVAAESGEAHIL